MAGSAEEMFFFEGTGGRKLLGFFHASSGPARPCALLYCHPFAEERNQSHGAAAHAARRLAAAGFPVLRFDFSGCGDSEGALEEASADDWLAEIGLAAAELKRRSGTDRVGVWGLRAGANLAARWALGRGDVALGIFWQPLADLKTGMTQFLRQRLGTSLAAGEGGGLSVKGLVERLEAGETVEVMGYPIVRKLYASMTSVSAPFAAAPLGFPACVAAVTEAEAPPEGIKRLAASLATPAGPAALLHARETPFWDRYWRWESPLLSELTVRWAASVR
jgi:exosortase A-associated hydrolase 2